MATKNVKGVKRADGNTYLYVDQAARTKIGTATLTTTAQDLSGAVNELKSGKADLDLGGKIPAAQLPSYVDDVLEYANKASFPATGESGKIYVDLATNKTYRWSGTAYVEISESLALGETSSTAYAGNKGKANANAIAVLNGTGAGSVSKAVSDAIATLDVSSVGGSGKYISAISEADGKISATAETMDTAPTEGSSKAVTSGGIKTAINDSVSLKTATGNPITLTDAANANAEELSMTIEPIQDLHGYTKPWPAGGGKNLLPLTVDGIKAVNTNGTWSGNKYSLNGVTFTIQTDSNENVTGIVLNGTASLLTTFTFVGQTLKYLSAGSYILNGSSDRLLTIRIRESAGNRWYSGPFTYNGSDECDCYLQVLEGQTLSNVTVNPMIRNATETDPTFEPYSNICPISGLTSGEVTRTGKNLFGNFELHKSISSETGENLDDVTGGFRTAGKIRTAGYTAISLTLLDSEYKGSFIVLQYSDSGYIGVVDEIQCTQIQYPYNRSLTLNAETTYIRIKGWYGKNVSSINTAQFQVTLGATPTAYEPYTATNATITFGRTVYGGSVNFKTGEVTVTHKLTTVGALTWSTQVSSFANFMSTSLASEIKKSNDQIVAKSDIYVGVTNSVSNPIPYCIYSNSSGHLKINDRRYSTVEDWLAVCSSAQVCYELATPTTLTLTPAELELLKGNNTITANGAEISIEYYPDNAIGALAERVDDVQEQIDRFNNNIIDPLNTYTNNGARTIYQSVMAYINGLSASSKPRGFVQFMITGTNVNTVPSDLPASNVKWHYSYGEIIFRHGTSYEDATIILYPYSTADGSRPYIKYVNNGTQGTWQAVLTDKSTGSSDVTKLRYLNNVTSDIQTQINGKANIVNLGTISANSNTDALNKAWDALAVYEKPVLVYYSYYGFQSALMFKYADSRYGTAIAMKYDSNNPYVLNVYNGTKYNNTVLTDKSLETKYLHYISIQRYNNDAATIDVTIPIINNTSTTMTKTEILAYLDEHDQHIKPIHGMYHNIYQGNFVLPEPIVDFIYAYYEGSEDKRLIFYRFENDDITVTPTNSYLRIEDRFVVQIVQNA